MGLTFLLQPAYQSGLSCLQNYSHMWKGVSSLVAAMIMHILVTKIANGQICHSQGLEFYGVQINILREQLQQLSILG